jgi:uncharacterized protein YndB with AHSA1/START domain
MAENEAVMREEIIMEEQSVIHSTFVIERSFPKPPERVFSAFADPAKKRRWFVDPETSEIEEFGMDFRVGGVERLRYRFKEGTPFKGVELTNEGFFLEIVPDRRVVSASTMALGGKRISASLVTIELLPTGNGSDRGTDLICTHQGAFFEGADGPQIREAGWRTLFDKLAAELTRSRNSPGVQSSVNSLRG